MSAWITVADAADPPVAVEAHLDLVLHLAGVIGRHQARADSSIHRTGRPARRAASGTRMSSG